MGLNVGDVGIDWLIADDVLAHVQFVREIYVGFVFLSSDDSLDFESFKVQDKDVWGFVDEHLFGGQFMLLALGTIPLIPFLKFLRGLQSLKTLIKRNIPLVISGPAINILGLIGIIPQPIDSKFLQPIRTEPNIDLIVSNILQLKQILNFFIILDDLLFTEFCLQI